VRPALQRLLDAPSGARLTVYLPVRAFPAGQNETARRHAVADAAKALEDAGVPGADAARRATGLENVLRELRAAPGTLAALECEGDVHVFPLTAELPYAVAARRSFVLRPLLRALAAEGTYRVLVVSAKHVALYEGDAGGLALAPQGDLPASLEDALGAEKTEKQLRMRGTRAGGGAPAYYAHDAANEERKIDLHRFHHVVAKAVDARLAQDATPLVLAADVSHQAGLRSALHVPALVEAPLLASPDHWSAPELHQRAYPLVAASRASADGAAAALERASKAGKLIDRLDDLAAAAAAGRIRRLWLDAERSVPGRIDPASGRVQPAEDDDELLEELAALAIRHGSEVRVVPASELPGASGAAAELR
jgi:hypothetical protein